MATTNVAVVLIEVRIYVICLVYNLLLTHHQLSLWKAVREDARREIAGEMLLKIRPLA